jgi:dTDP-glucose 4,6-dehydratase
MSNVNSFNNPLENDLNYIFLETKYLWEELRNKRIFITGGTGFFGCWLLESFVFINKKMKLNAEVTILTRDPKDFSKKCPHLFKDPSLHFYKGNILDFTFPIERFSYIIHAAMDYGTVTNETNYFFMLNSIVNGTKRTLEFAKTCGANKILFISSGAIYKNKIKEIDLTSFISSYAAGKYIAEFMCHSYAKRYQFSVKIARCFSFVGPYLPLNLHYAIGNFIHDRLNNKMIVVRSDGSSYRSYLYTADLAIWLWTILFRGESLFPYDVGSDKALTIKELAILIASLEGHKVNVKIMQKTAEETVPESYVPNIMQATKDLKLVQKVSLVDAIRKTIAWHTFKQQNT